MAEQLELFDERELPRERPAPPAPESPHPAYGPDSELTEIASVHARQLELPGLAKDVVVVWNHRMRTAAGRAFYQTGRIELNPKLQELPEQDREKEIHHTFLHELAHLISFARASGKRIQPHGPEWRRACHDLGIPDEDRCHSLDFEPRKMKRRFAYECGNCGTVVKRVRKLKRTVACYDCCRSHSGGQYDARFRLVEKPLG